MATASIPWLDRRPDAGSTADVPLLETVKVNDPPLVRGIAEAGGLITAPI
jgi:hypothetical protein